MAQLPEQLRILEECVRDASADSAAEALLRAIVKGAADKAPIPALVELGRVLVDIRMRDLADAN